MVYTTRTLRLGLLSVNFHLVEEKSFYLRYVCLVTSSEVKLGGSFENSHLNVFLIFLE